MKIAGLRIAPPAIPLPPDYRLADWLLCLLPAIGILVVQSLYWLAYDFIMNCDGFLTRVSSCWAPVVSQHAPAMKVLSIPTTLRDTTVAKAASSAISGEFNARLAWMAAVVILAAVCVTAVALAVRWIGTCLGNAAGTRAFTTLLTIIGLAWGIYSGSRAQHFVVLQDLFANSPKLPFLDTVRSSVFLMRLLTFFGATFIIGAACVTPAPPPRDTTDEVARARHFAGSIQQLQYILYAGAALLLTGVIEFRTLLGWNASAVDPPFASLVRDSGYAAAAATGTIYAAGLAALYFPAALILEMQGRKLAEGSLRASKGEKFTRKDVSNWMQENGLIFSAPRSLSSLLAVLSPLLIQIPVAALLDALK